MKNKKILTIMIITMLFTGCSASKGEDLLNEGKLALERHDYTKAEDILAQVLTADTSNENARSMYIQTVNMKNVAEYEGQKNYDKAIVCLEIIEKLKSGSSEIKDEASKKKKEIMKLNEEYKNAKEERKENAKYASSQGRYKLEKDAIKANQNQLAKKEKEEQQRQEEENTQQNNTQQDVIQQNNTQSGNIQGSGSQGNVGGVTETPSNQPSQPDQTQ